MLNLRAELRLAVAAAVRAAQKAGELPRGDIPDVIIEYPPHGAPPAKGTRGAKSLEHLGDYASPIALTLARQWKRRPMEVAEAVAKHLTPPEFVRKIEGVAPGYLNFHLSPEWLTTKVDDVIEEGDSLGRADVGQGISVNLEFVSANPTGEPHVGNGRALFTADVLGNVLARAGYAVTREYYVNDMGAQVEKYGESVLRRILQGEGIAVDYPADLYPGADVKTVAAQVREELVEDRGHTFTAADLENAELRSEITRRAVDATIRRIRHVLEEVAKVRYDVWFRESTLHREGAVADVLAQLKKRGHTEERDDALWLKSTASGDDKDRVLVKKGGEMTYLASDIAYHRDKLRRGYQVLVDFWGEDHQGHILPLRAGLAALGEDAERLRVLLVHMVRVVRGGQATKISKRLGTAVALREVLDLVGLSAARFFLTMKSLASPLEFDLDLAVAAKEENPVYYVQYAHVRLASILRKAKEQNIIDGTLSLTGPLTPLTDPAEVRLLVLMARLPDTLEDVIRTWEVQRLPQYALELARAVHQFYDTVPVLGTKESGLLRSRLALITAAQRTLSTVFDLLGVEKREVM